ncbi:hypothetical protein [Salinicoccus roseus]|uniref:hypothetical protein n=1 Tax=Salinicoccus roseus TaxID=45670 RepID=UPI00147558E5|nr:hypothetical protein [Salinicoccus roseus]
MDITLEEFKINAPSLYVFCSQKNKFIYDKPSKGTIVGMTRGLTNQIVEVKAGINSGDRHFSHLYIDHVPVGWVESEDMLRVYRLPHVHGKVITCSNDTFNGICFKEKLARIKGRVVRAKYYFTYDDKPYLMLKAIGDKTQVPVPYEDFSKLVGVKETHHITLPKDTPLYSTSRLDSMVTRCEKEKAVKVLSFFKGTAQVKINTEGQNFWINRKVPFEIDERDYINVDKLETIDTLAYLKERSELQSKKLKHSERTLNLIRENLKIGSDLETLYLKKYLGNVGESDDD